MLANLAVTLVHLGYIDQARSRLNEALSEARRLRQAQTLALVLVFAAMIGSLTRSSEMQKHAQELLSLTTEHGLSFYLGSATAFRGSSLIAIGQVQEGLTLLTQGLAAVRATGTVAGTPGVLISLADGYAKLGRPLEGMNCLAEAAQIVETTEQRAGEVYLHRLRGELLNAIGDRTAAEQSYRQALAVAQRQRAKLSELTAAASFARLWRDQDKRTEAHDLLAPVYGWFTEGFDTPVLQDAKTLFDQLV